MFPRKNTFEHPIIYHQQNLQYAVVLVSLTFVLNFLIFVHILSFVLVLVLSQLHSSVCLFLPTEY